MLKKEDHGKPEKEKKNTKAKQDSSSRSSDSINGDSSPSASADSSKPSLRVDEQQNSRQIKITKIKEVSES